MEQYISKSPLLAEINKRIIDAPIDYIGHQRVWAYNDVKNIIDTLEVKEVKLEEEIDKYVNTSENQGNPELREELSKCARCFYELGLNTKKNMETPNGTLSPMHEAMFEACKRLEESGEGLSFYDMFKAGAEWMNEQLKKK